MHKELVQYIESNIYPLYSRNDWAHQLWHIEDVTKKSLKLAKGYSVNLDMVYVIASFHDLGCFISRDNHEEISAHLMEQDHFIQNYFSDEDIQIMKEAIEDHRGSRKERPRNRYGEILSDSDRDFDIKLLAKRQLATSIKNYPEFTTFDQHFEHCYAYIKKRIDAGGHFNLWTNHPVLVERRVQFEKDFFQKEYAREVYQKEWQRITTDGTYEKIQNYYMDY